MSGPLLAMAGWVAVACVLAGLAVWGIGRAGDASAGTGSPPGTHTPPGTYSSAARPPEDAESQARAVAALIDDSNVSRTAVKAAVVSTKSCDRLSANANTFRTAAAQRGRQRDNAKALPAGALPDGDTLIATLAEALDESQRADEAFARWAAALTGDCRSGATVTADFTMADRYSNSATADKKKFVAMWNPIARDHGLRQFVYSDV